MKLSQKLAEIAELKRSALLEQYAILIGDDQITEPDKILTLAETVEQLAGFGVDLNVDADRIAVEDVARLENKLEPQPLPDAQKKHEAKIVELEEEAREATIVELAKSIDQLDFATAVAVGLDLVGNILFESHQFSERLAAAQEIKAVDGGDESAVEQIGDLAAELVRNSRSHRWESAIRRTVRQFDQLDRKLIFAPINAGNAKLQSLPEPPKEAENRNHWRRHEIAMLKQKHPLAFAPPAPEVEPVAEVAEVEPAAIEEPESPDDQAEPGTSEPVAESELVAAE